MILSVSRRTDIPAFYSEWFFNRVKEGFVYVRNPMNVHQISNISINPDVIDCIVFWSKDPSPMLPRIDELNKFKYYFQFTVNPYDQKLETFVPKKKIVIETFKKLSDKIGSDKIIWRYDPILLTDKITIEYHIKYFEEIAKRLSGYANICVISFIDEYKKVENNLKGTMVQALNEKKILEIAPTIAQIASSYGFKIQTCAENIDLNQFGIRQGRCIDNNIIENLIGEKILSTKDKNQRKECGCIQSIDIGEYNTCNHNCLYCYANFNKKVVSDKREKHNPNSPLLIGEISNKDTINERKIFSIIDRNQIF
jgi:DNA repair photolyase